MRKPHAREGVRFCVGAADRVAAMYPQGDYSPAISVSCPGMSFS